MLKTLESNTVLNKIIDSIKELKGMDIVLLDLRKIENAICKFFVICTGNSNTHAKAIEDKIRRNIKKKHNENPLRVEGTNHENLPENFMIWRVSGILIYCSNENEKVFFRQTRFRVPQACTVFNLSYFYYVSSFAANF